MANEAIRSRSDELVIVAETGIDSPLTAERACTGPGKETGEGEKKNRKRDLPGLRRPFPETALPQKTIGDADKKDAPASAAVYLLGRLLGFPGPEKWRTRRLAWLRL
jgi:hypothetical protein